MLTGDDDMLVDEDLRVLNRDAEEEPKKMDPLGYKIRVWVYYDDRWKNRFGLTVQVPFLPLSTQC